MAEQSLKLSARVAKRLQDLARKLGGSVSVGFFEGETYSDGTPVASVAFWNEYGHQGPFPAPPRPFFRTMIAKESPTWGRKMAALAKATNYDGDRVLNIMGEDIARALGESITELTAPPLSPTTLMLRQKFGNSPEKIRARDVVEAQRDVAAGKSGATGSQAKPLVWTDRLLRAPEFKVEK